MLRCLPESDGRQRVLSSSVQVIPGCTLTPGRDHFGPRQCGTIMAPHAGFSVQAQGCVDISACCSEKAASPWQLGPYRTITPLTSPGPALQALAESLPPQQIPRAVMQLLATRFTYHPGSTHAATTAEEAAAQMRGVCQDEAHIMLSLLRMKKIPCRYVMGYMLGEGSTHAWVEVLQEGCWLGLDPTNRCPVNEEYIRIAVGRDAGDCPVNRGVFSGAAQQQSQSCLSVWHID